MKKFFQFALMALAVTAMVSCGPDDPTKDNPKNPELKITVSDITDIKAHISVTSTVSDKAYAMNFVSADQAAQMGEVADIAASYFDFLLTAEASAEKAGSTLYEFLLDQGYLYKGDISEDFGPFTGGTEYTVFAFYVNEEMTEITGITSSTFKTEASQAMTFEFTMDDENKLTVTPSGDGLYLLGIVEIASMVEQGFAEKDIDKYFSAWLKYIYSNKLVEKNVFKGPYTFDVTAVVESDFYIFAMSIDGTGQPVGDTFYAKKFEYSKSDYAPRKASMWTRYINNDVKAYKF